MHAFFSGFLSRVLTVPPLPPLDLPLAARAIPAARRTVEAVCQVFFWAGASQGLWLGLALGFVLIRVHDFARSAARAVVRLVNLRLSALGIPPDERETLP